MHISAVHKRAAQYTVPMLSYRHAYHAGNHADVLKHLVLVQILRYLSEKPAPFWVIDTHAGAGRYALESAHATRLAEFEAGVGRLWQADALPPATVDYLEQVKMLNPDGALRHYPGSPWLTYQALRPGDKARFFERHSSDSALLQACFQSAGRTVKVSPEDGFAGLKACLPPPPRRALVLIDPSYEMQSDYPGVIHALKDSLKRFSTGCYMLWYPRLSKLESRQLPDRLKAIGAEKWLHVTLDVSAPAKDGFGMHGSGLFIINPPWTLEKILRDTLPDLSARLAQSEGAGFTLTSAG